MQGRYGICSRSTIREICAKVTTSQYVVSVAAMKLVEVISSYYFIISTATESYATAIIETDEIISGTTFDERYRSNSVVSWSTKCMISRTFAGLKDYIIS